MTKTTTERELSTTPIDEGDAEAVLVARIASDRRAGRGTTQDAATLLRLAGENNRAALDRLAQ